MKYESVRLENPEGKLWHIGVNENDIGKHVILPGDPARCKMVAQYFDSAECKAVSRGNPVYTGKFHGVDVSVMSTGMGGMAVAVCVEELKHIGAKTLIRMGTSGALQRDIPSGSFVIATGAVRGEGATREYMDISYPGVEPYLGIVRSHDAFYLESPGAHEGWEERIKPWTDANVLAIENESATLFTLGSLLRGLRTGTILLTGPSLYEAHGRMGTMNDPDYPNKVKLLTQITLGAIEKIDKLPELKQR